MRLASYILLSLNGTLWGGMTLLGGSVLRGVAAQHAPGYPNYGQVTYYLAFPLAMLLLSTARPAWRWRVGKQNLGVGALTATLVLLPIYLFAYTGGV